MPNKKLKAVSNLSIIDELENLQPTSPKNDPLFKFENPGNWIYARFIGRRHGVQTQSVEKPSIVLDIEILASKVNGEEGSTGKCGTFESAMISQIMDGAKLNSGDLFYLKHTGNAKAKKGRVKQFSFKKLTEEEAVKFEKALDNVAA